jgi:hypothetical protein
MAIFVALSRKILHEGLATLFRVTSLSGRMVVYVWSPMVCVVRMRFMSVLWVVSRNTSYVRR